MTLWHQSGVNTKGEPFVQLFVDEKCVGQLTPEEARDHARATIEAAEAAEQDAFLYEWAQGGGASRDEAAMLLVQFRRFREARGKKGPVSDPKEFVVTDEHRKKEPSKPE